MTARDLIINLLEGYRNNLDAIIRIDAAGRGTYDICEVEKTLSNKYIYIITESNKQSSETVHELLPDFPSREIGRT